MSRCIVWVAAFIAIGWVLRDYVALRLGPHGFEWTERYATLLRCNGRDMLLTRMRYIGRGKYLPVLRYAWDETAYVLWNLSLVAFNPTLVCHNNTPFVVGSANKEWHIFAHRESSPRIRLVSLDGHTRNMRFNVSSCVERHFSRCAFDGKFSIVRRKHEWYAFIRANGIDHSGGRYVQVARARTLRGPWSPFRLIDIQGVPLSVDTNVYIFEVQVVNHTFVAHFPAVVRNESGTFESGIFATRSEDGVRWDKPVLLHAVARIGVRIPMLPVGVAHQMDINLWWNAKSVQIQTLDGHALKGFRTRRLI